MKIINREIGYAIRSLCFMVQQDNKIVSTGQLADYFNISRPFLRKILQKLNQAGVLDSYKGKRGGFRLILSPEQIFLTDLIKIFQGPVRLSGCYEKEKECPLVTDCHFKLELERVERRFLRDLSSMSLSIIIKKQNKQNNIVNKQ